MKTKINQFQLIKIALISLTIAGRLTSSLTTLKPKFRTVPYYLEPAKQIN